MIGSRLDLVGLQNLRQLLHFLTREAVDNTALRGMLLDKADNILIYILGLRTHFIIKVRAVKRTLELCRIQNT